MTTNLAGRILVWDLPTRLFHWGLALSFGGAYLTAESERYRDIHVTLGYAMIGLILFRILWGFIGSRYARFSSLPLRPSAVKRYLASLISAKPEHHVGHNPAGSYAVLALIGLAAGACLTGYLTYNDQLGDELHEVVANAMLVLVGVHIAAVFVSSLLHKENLVRSMVTGFKQGRLEDGVRGSRWALGTALVAAIVGAFTTLAQASPPKDAAQSADGGQKQHSEAQGSSHRDKDDD
jgi:cytochrome b